MHFRIYRDFLLTCVQKLIPVLCNQLDSAMFPLHSENVKLKKRIDLAQFPPKTQTTGTQAFFIIRISIVIKYLNKNSFTAASCTKTQTGTERHLAQYPHHCSYIGSLLSSQCHSGIMGGGHYVTYAKNPNEKWYCYNDSSCKVRPVSLCL